jgi:hypothetical protein
LLKNSVFGAQPPKGTPQFKELAASLKRCPDTRLEFFRSVKPNSKQGSYRSGSGKPLRHPKARAARVFPASCKAQTTFND